MKPLETCERLLTFISVCPAEENIAKWKKLFFKMFPVIIFASALMTLIGNVLYFLRFMSSDLEKGLFASYQIAGELGVINSIIVTFITRQKLLNIFESLKRIYRASEEGIEYFTQANDRSEWVWRLFMKFIIVAVVCCTIILPIVSVLLLKMQKKPYEFDSVYHTMFMLLPWNRDTLLGYFYENCYSIFCVFNFIFPSCIELLLFVSVCWHHQAFYKIFRHTVRTLHSPDNNRRDKIRILRELIQFHNSATGWFLETANFFSPYMLCKMVTSIIFLASDIFQLDMQFQHLGFNVITVIMALIVGIANMLFYCWFGKLATERFLSIADCVYESNWQDMPNDLQKYLIVIIANAQIPLNYHGYGMIYLNLDTFTKMLKTVFSSYMMFKTLTK